MTNKIPETAERGRMRKCFVVGAAFVGVGCSRAPSINVLGAFFPGWLFCFAGALALTLVTRAVLIKLGLLGRVGPLLLFYPALGAIFTFLCWLIFFQG